jgi:moderate conductance mechanosensitive channel
MPMYDDKTIIRVIGQAAAISLIFIIAATALPYRAFAEPQAAASPKVHELATQLAEEWLKEQGVTRPTVAPSAPQTNQSFGDYVNSRAGAFHDQIVALASAIPDLPNEFDRAVDRVIAFDADSGSGQVFLDLGVFGDKYRVATRRLAAGTQALLNLVLIGACGFGAQWLFRRITERVRGRLAGVPLETVNDRLRVIITRFALTFGVIAAFVAGILSPSLRLIWIRSVGRWSRAF